MNKLILFGVLLCLVAVNARHFGDRQDAEPIENEEETLRRPRDHLDMNRRRRRRWQAYNYDYPQPPYAYHDRRDYDRNQDVLQNIYRLLEEISANLRRPPPPSPPVYIPYPVPYPFLQIPKVPKVSCTPTNTSVKEPVDLGNRFGDIDPNQNWGMVEPAENDYDDGSDGARPISLDPISPKQFVKRPAPKVEHGSVQASQSAQVPKFAALPPVAASTTSAPIPGMCNAARLSCCGMTPDQQKQCFANMGCDFDNGSCSPASIQIALESFKAAYSPLN